MTSIGDVLSWLDNHAAVIALLTAFASFLLFLEARAARIRAEAIVEAVPDHYGQGLYLAVAVINSGPAVARDFSLTTSLRHPTDPTQTTVHQMDRRALPTGQGLVLPRVHDEVKALRQLAEGRFVLDLRWQWKDGRRWFWFGPRRVHRRNESYPTDEFFEGVRTSGLLTSPTTETDILLTKRVEEPLREVSRHLGEIASAIERPDEG